MSNNKTLEQLYWVILVITFIGYLLERVSLGDFLTTFGILWMLSTFPKQIEWLISFIGQSIVKLPKLLWKLLKGTTQFVVLSLISMFLIASFGVGLERLIESIPLEVRYYTGLVLVGCLLVFIVWMLLMAIRALYDYGQGKWK